MNYRDFLNFLENEKDYTEEELLASSDMIYEYLKMSCRTRRRGNYLKKIFEIVDKNKILPELLKHSEKFSMWKQILDVSEKINFGLEIEVANVLLEEIKELFDSNLVTDIMKFLEIPDDISEKIIGNSDFEKKDEPNKWIFSSEPCDVSEASTPIMKNTLENLNQIVAICTLYKALGGKLHGGTGLHINIGAEYFECNEKALENMLRIWGECEELFFKTANPEGEVIRVQAPTMATPIKENIQNFFEEDGSVTLNTDEDMEKFLYKIQARNRMYNILVCSDMELGNDYDFEYQFVESKNDEERLEIYRQYHRVANEKKVSSRVRWTSINFNHMKWNSENPGRIEMRIFNSSLEPEIIFQDLLFCLKFCEVCLKNAKNPIFKKAEFEKLYRHDLTETEKVDAMLDLIFDKLEHKKIFKDRWKSVRNNEKYKALKSGRDTFR